MNDLSDSPDALPGFWQAFLDAPMHRVQKLSILALTAMCALDGLDLFAITFAAPVIGREMAIGKAAIGLVLAAALAGMALGSLFLSPLADIYGRRRPLLFSLLMMIGGTLWTALAGNLFDLIGSRLITGLGVGTMAAVINPLAAEYANAKRRDISVAIVNLGLPAGAIVSGILAAWMIPLLGWRALFLVASGLGMVMLAIVLLWLPESIVGILSRGGPATQTRLNHLLNRCGQPASVAPDAIRPRARRRSIRLLLTPAELPATVAAAAIFFLFTLSLYYIQSWVPSLITGAGHTVSQAALAATAMSVSGVLGGSAFAFLVPRLGLKRVVIAAVTLTGLAIVLFGVVPMDLPVLVAMSVLVGASTIGGMVNLYAILSRNFPPSARASGIGFVIGVGRFGSALGPALGGLLFSLGHERAMVSLVMAMPALLAAALLLRIRQRDYA